jgi:hypothetical protein
MTTYNTTSQWESSRSRRRIGFAGCIVTLAAGAYMLLVYLNEGAYVYTSSGGFSLTIALFFFVITLVPLTYAYGRRLHPRSVDVTSEKLLLNFPEGRVDEYKWADGPVDMAVDSRTAPPGKRRPAGLEVTVWIPVGGRDPGSAAFRPQELQLSGQAFDEIRRRMEEAGYSAVESVNKWDIPENVPRRKALTQKSRGTIWRFEKLSPKQG